MKVPPSTGIGSTFVAAEEDDDDDATLLKVAVLLLKAVVDIRGIAGIIPNVASYNAFFVFR